MVLAVLSFQLLIQFLALLVLHVKPLYQLIVTTVIVLLHLIKSKLDSFSLWCFVTLSCQLISIELRRLSRLLLLLLSFKEIQMLCLLLIVRLVLLSLIDGIIDLLHHITIHIVTQMVTPHSSIVHLLLLIV